MTGRTPPSAACLFEEIEARILCSVDLPTAAPVYPVAERAPEPASILVISDDLDQLVQAPATEVLAREIAFVDASLADVEGLLRDVRAMNSAGRQVDVVLLRSDQDGVAQISAALQGARDIDAVHLLTHGARGELQIGATALDFDALLANAARIREWGLALSDGADIFIYGCDVAQSDDGERLVQALSSLTGADVAASTDLTGSTAHGGDWQLEHTQGDVNLARGIGFAGVMAWQGVLPDQFAVNTTTASIQATDGTARGSQHAVSMDAAGNYVVVWTSRGQDGSQDGVYARRFAANGAALTGEILVNQTTNKDQKWASVAADSTGNFVVSWTNRDDSGDQGDIYIRRFDGSGNALTVETLVNTTSSSSVQENATLAMDAASGDFVVAWQGVGTGDGDGVFFRRYNADGTAKDASEQRANSADSGDEKNPAVAMSSSGFVIAWERSDRIYFQRFNAAGVAQGGITQAGSGLTDITLPTVGMSATGDFTILYRCSTPLLTGVWGHGFNADGTQKYAVFQVASGDSTDPSLAMAADGSFIVTYDRTGSTDSASQGVYARKYLANGSADGSAFLVNQYTSGQQLDASVALTDTDNSVVVWSGQGSGDSDGVHARQFGAPNTAPVNNVPGAQSAWEDEALVFSSGNGNLISISDADAGTGTMQVTLTATQGVITLGTTASLVFSTGDGTSDSTMTFSATRAQINTALAGLQFTPTADFNGSATLQIDTDDLGNSGFGGALTDSDTITITVTAVNDAPVAVGDAYTVLQGQTLNVAAAGVLTNDTDTEGNSLQVLTYTDVANGSITVAADGSLSYTPTGGYTGADAFSYLVRDTSDGRTHYWGMGGHANDAIAGANGTVSGAATVAGQFGSALGFDGVSDHASIPDFTYSSAFSVSFWFKTPSNAGSQFSYLYSHGQVGTSNSLNVYLIEDSTAVAGAGMLRTYFRDVNDTDEQHALDISVAGLGLADNAWHLYTLTAQSTAGAKVYIDGVLQASSARGGDAFNPSGSLVLGGREDLDSNRFFAGAMDGVQVHDHALTLQEIDDIHTATPASVAFTVTTNTAPVITSHAGAVSASISVAENSTAVVTMTTTDNEAPPQSLTYSLSGADAARFSIGSSTGVLAFNSAPDRENATDADADHVYEVTVTVSDGITTDTQDLSVTVTDVNELSVGVIADLDAGADTVAENAANTTGVGITAHATDGDATNNTVTYVLDNDAGGRFAIDSVTGVVSVAGTSLLDYELATSHSITVRANSSDGSTRTATFTISLQPQNEHAPVFTSSAAPSMAEGGTSVLTLTATDADAPAQSIVYVVSAGADQAHFAVSGTTLRFVSAPDYEMPLDANGDNIYEVRISASDGAGGITFQDLMVSVTDVDESVPVVTPPPVVVLPPTDPGVTDPAAPPTTTSGTATGSAAEPAPAPSTTTGVAAPVVLVPQASSPDAGASEDLSVAAASTSRTMDSSAAGRRGFTPVAGTSQSGAWVRPQFLPVAQPDSLVLGPGMSAAPAAAVSAEALRSSLGGAQWLGQLQFMRDQMEEDMRLEGVMVGTTAFVSGGLSVGYVIWLVRGGLLMSTLLSSLPAWHSIDPLPVLGQRGGDDDAESRSDEVEGMFERARKAWRAGKSVVPATGEGAAV